jgi:putative hemolysin
MTSWVGNALEDVVSDNGPPQARLGNADYQWGQFDPEAYFQHYYGEPHPDDERVIRYAVEAMKQAPPVDTELDVVDVGTGPNLIPFFCALPRARRLTAWEYARGNIAWLESELRRKEMRPQWRHFWNVTREAYLPECPLPDDPMPLLREKCIIRRGSIFDLPERTWDAATMFFCAESITERPDEFEAACAAYARCVKRGGALAAAFLAHSAGYVVEANRFPALPLSAESIVEAFAPHAEGLKAEAIGIVERPVRSGYSGLVFLTGNAR